jgi:hypothetical protein
MCGSSKVTQTTEQKLSPEQRELMQLGMTGARGAMETAPSVPGTLGFTPAQTAAQESTLAKTGEGGVVSNLASNLGGAQSFLTGDVMKMESNPYLQDAINAALRPITENFQQSVIPSIRSGAVQAGPTALGGSRTQLALSGASGDYMRQLGDTAASMANTAYGQNLDALVKGTALAPQTMQAMLFPESAQEAVGAQQRQLATEQAYDPMRQNELDWSRALQLLGAAGSTPGGGTTGTVTPASGSGTAGTIAQGIGSALPLLMLMSDRRLKRNIHKIADTTRGFGLYVFNYLWDITLHLGYMADEVERVLPSAVGTDPSTGYKYINYAAIL